MKKGDKKVVYKAYVGQMCYSIANPVHLLSVSFYISFEL